MTDYYKILGVKRRASAAEIKSAYRRLARERHPDVNNGTERATREFALLALAYRTLSDPHERAHYDARYEKLRSRNVSVMRQTSPQARYMHQVVVEARMNRIVDSMLAADRRDTLALQQTVYPIVALFLSSFFAALLKPRFWQSMGFMGRAVMILLFLIGLWHLANRLRVCLARYSRTGSGHDSICEELIPGKPFTPRAAYVFLISGSAISFGIGFLLNMHMHYVIFSRMPVFFDHRLHPELLFYPPIVVLIVDTVHALGLKMDL